MPGTSAWSSGSTVERGHLAGGRGVGSLARRRGRAAGGRSSPMRTTPRSPGVPAGPQPRRLRARARRRGRRRDRPASLLGATRRTAARRARAGARGGRRSCRGWRGSSRSSRVPASRSGLLVEERRRKAPEDTFFLFEDRAYSANEVNERIDNVVRGLISIGVRQGEHVGVLMGTRPSALALVGRDQPARRGGGAAAALTATRRARRELGQVQRIIADPERAALAAGLRRGAHVRARRRRRPARPRDAADTTDMEQIDPRRGHAPAVVPAQPGTRQRPGVHPLHRRGRADADEPDHQPALGHVGVRHRLVGGADRRATRSTASRRSYHPSGLMMSDRRGDRRRCAAGDGDRVRSRDVLGGGPPLRRHRRVLHLDAVARARRGAARAR